MGYDFDIMLMSKVHLKLLKVNIKANDLGDIRYSSLKEGLRINENESKSKLTVGGVPLLKVCTISVG